MSSGLYPNSTTLYLRPIEYTQRYRIRDAAVWMSTKRNISPANALHLLIILQTRRPAQFKNIMSAYYAEVDYETKYVAPGDPDTYRSNTAVRYGDDPHLDQC